LPEFPSRMRGDLSEAVEVIRAAVLGDIPHGFLGRRGGVSRGAIAGLNVGHGAGDDPDTVAANRARAVATVSPGARLVTLHQTHSPTCVTVHEPWPETDRPHADALVTDRPGLLLGILTADCAPILMADGVAGVVGAAHAGWKGALGGVLEATVAAMTELGARPERIAAAIGPCISQASYEVDAAFRERFVTADSGNDRFFIPGRAERHQFDLEGYVASCLESAGVGTIEPLGRDSYDAPEQFFSFRRATHRGEPAYGRQISLIGLA
jgi:YfiH family protein